MQRRATVSHFESKFEANRMNIYCLKKKKKTELFIKKLGGKKSDSLEVQFQNFCGLVFSHTKSHL